MNQTFHIFKKDVRRFSWEIALSLCLLAIYAWCQPVSWMPPFAYPMGTGFTLRYLGSNFMGMLLVLGWLLILVRLIYEDSPAGDRQFWVTRPYRWHNLLAAKVLFFLAVITIPLLIVQLGLTAAAGFAPFHDLSRVADIHLFLAGFFLIVAALAVITGGRTALARAGIVVLVFLVIWTAIGTTTYEFHPWGEASGWDWVGRALLVAIPIVVILRQYALRKTTQARWILFSGAVLLTVLSVFASPKILNEAEFPQPPANTEPYFQLNMRAPEKPQQQPAAAFGFSKSSHEIPVAFKLSGTGVAADRVIQAYAINVTLKAPDGALWNSGWIPNWAILEHQNGVGMNAQQDQSTDLPNRLDVDKRFFDHVKDTLVTVHVGVAGVLFRDNGGVAISPVQNELKISDLGTCIVTQSTSWMLWCRSATKAFPLMAFTQKAFKSCPPEKDDRNEPAGQRTAWFSDRQMNDFGLSPVLVFRPYANSQRLNDRDRVCPDSAFNVRQPEKIQQFRVEKDFVNIKLADYLAQP